MITVSSIKSIRRFIKLCNIYCVCVTLFYFPLLFYTYTYIILLHYLKEKLWIARVHLDNPESISSFACGATDFTTQ